MDCFHRLMLMKRSRFELRIFFQSRHPDAIAEGKA
jgi:hypothetical protein